MTIDGAATRHPDFLTVAPQFTVPDVIAAASYYCDVLGFENGGFFGEPPVFVMLGRGGVEVFFNQSSAAAGRIRPRTAVGYDAYIHARTWMSCTVSSPAAARTFSKDPWNVSA